MIWPEVLSQYQDPEWDFPLKPLLPPPLLLHLSLVGTSTLVGVWRAWTNAWCLSPYPSMQGTIQRRSSTRPTKTRPTADRSWRRLRLPRAPAPFRLSSTNSLEFSSSPPQTCLVFEQVQQLGGRFAFYFCMTVINASFSSWPAPGKFLTILGGGLYSFSSKTQSGKMPLSSRSDWTFVFDVPNDQMRLTAPLSLFWQIEGSLLKKHHQPLGRKQTQNDAIRELSVRLSLIQGLIRTNVEHHLFLRAHHMAGVA